MSSKLEASQRFLNRISNTRISDKVESLIESENEKNLATEGHDPNDLVTLNRVMELDGLTLATPMRELIESPHKAHLFAADAANFAKRRLLDNYSGLQDAFSVDGGILASTVGTIHRPPLLDLCGGRELRIKALPDNKNGSVGQWKPMEYPGADSFKHAPYEEILTVTPEYMETPMGAVYKYAFAMQLTTRNTLSAVSVDVASRWMEGVLLMLECEMLNDFYNKLILKGKRVTTQELGSRTRDGSLYEIDWDSWEGLKDSFGKNHGLTDVFCHSDQDKNIKKLPIRNSGSVIVNSSDALVELRNRLADGTYCWSHFLDEPDEDLIPAIDRSSCAALYYVEDSEISERKINILSGSTTITFSVTLGFDVIDEGGLKVVEVK